MKNKIKLTSEVVDATQKAIKAFGSAYKLAIEVNVSSTYIYKIVNTKYIGEYVAAKLFLKLLPIIDFYPSSQQVDILGKVLPDQKLNKPNATEEELILCYRILKLDTALSCRVDYIEESQALFDYLVMRSDDTRTRYNQLMGTETGEVLVEIQDNVVDLKTATIEQILIELKSRGLIPSITI